MKRQEGEGHEGNKKTTRNTGEERIRLSETRVEKTLGEDWGGRGSSTKTQTLSSVFQARI